MHGSLRMPEQPNGKVPAVILLAGSGPTDRNGDSALLPGSIGTLRFLADTLARNGVASLRFDKIGTGTTGIGPLSPGDIANLGFDTFIDEAADGVRFIATQPGIDTDRIGAVGHSEGALIALALANGKGGDIPTLSSLALVEPASLPILDVMTRQINGQIDAAVANEAMSKADGDALSAALAHAVTQLRESGTVPTDLPKPLLNAGLVPANAKALADEDRLDPLELASTLPAQLPVLTSCSDKDIQVSCDEVAGLDHALAQTRLDSVHLTNANHVLKVVSDGPSTGAEYGQPLPFSPEFESALSAWLASR